MLSMQDIRRATDLLASGDSIFDSVELLETGEIRLTATCGTQITLHVTGLTLPAAAPGGARDDPDLFASQPGWHEATLERRGLPPEWSREWLLRQLYLHGGEAGAAAATGRSEASLRHYRAVHDLQNLNQEYARLLWSSGAYRTQKELARAMKISEGQVSTYVGKAGENGKRGGQNEAARAVILELLVTHGHLPARAFNALAVKCLREAGDTRAHRKLAALIKRVRQESAQ